MPGAHWGQKRVSNGLKLELWKVASHRVDAGNQTQVLYGINKCCKLLNSSLAPSYFNSPLSPVCVAHIVLSVWHPLEYGLPSRSHTFREDKHSLPEAIIVSSAARGGASWAHSHSMLRFLFRLAFDQVLRMLWQPLRACTCKYPVVSRKLFWCNCLQPLDPVFLPLLSWWSLSLEGSEYELDVPYRAENFPISYLLYVAQLRVSVLNLLWGLGNALIYG